MIERGTVLWFDHSRGHRVIQSSDGRLIVVHSAWINSLIRRELSDGQAVEYRGEEGPDGLCATRVRWSQVICVSQRSRKNTPRI